MVVTFLVKHTISSPPSRNVQNLLTPPPRPIEFNLNKYQMKSPSIRQYNLPDAQSILHYQEISTRCKSPPDNMGYFKRLERYFCGYQGFPCSEKSSSSVNFQEGFTFVNTTHKRIFKGLDFVFSPLFPPTFFIYGVLNQKSFSNETNATNEVTNI